jgi:RpiB/LacA/LacB family sugar-phosphate isomerase
VRVAVAFDHRGVKLKSRIAEAVRGSGHELLDLGVDAPEPAVDYPDLARKLGDAVLAGEAERGVLVCGSGVGASVAANKLPGIRAAICHDVYSAHQGVEHDDMNILCLGSADLVATFLRAEFDGGERYRRRLEKIEEMEGIRHG